MEITASMVRELRDKTGLPMMDCKKALEEAAGDEPKAIEILRKRGMAQLSKRASNETGHGRVYFATDSASGRAALVELLCESEPVTDTEDFARLGAAAAQAAVRIDQPTVEAVMHAPAPNGGTVNDLYMDIINRIRENIRIGRIGLVAGSFGHYLHHDGRKGVMVEFNAPCPADAAADVCMHITAMRPMFTRRDEVPAEMVETERRVAAEQVKDKPEQIQAKIIDGKLDRWYGEFVLLEQPFVKDDKKSVGAFLKEQSAGLTVNRFVRLEVGDA